MTPQRIKELIQMLWNDVDSAAGLQAFVRKYGHELDGDFMDSIAATIKGNEAAGNENAANFFRQIKQALLVMAQASQKGGRAEFSSEEAQIKAEGDAIGELRRTDSNAAYTRAVANLERAEQIGNDNLVIYCAFTLALVAQEFRPYPKMNEAIAAYHIAAEKAKTLGNDRAYAGIQNNLGTSYQSLSTGDRGENLNCAIECYQNALRITTEQDFPKEYAETQNNLGAVYGELPTGDRTQNLRQAIACFQNALRILNEKDFPQGYATTQMHLGNAYGLLPTGDRGDNLSKAIECYKNTLRIYNEDKFSEEYAMTQNNLGRAYSGLPTGDRGENLKQAIACYENALRTRTEKDFPQYYADTQNNLGSAYSNIPTGDSGENLKNAIGCYKNALRIYSENDFPQLYAIIQDNLGTAYSGLPTGDREENLRQAIACHENALRILTEDRFPQDYASTQNNLGIAYSDLPTGNRGENLKQAIARYENALRIRTEDRFPQDYASTQNNMGNAYSDLPTGDRGENLKNAIQCYENALRIRTEKNFPQYYADIQNNLGVAYSNLPMGDRGENLKQAIACYENALRVRTEDRFPRDYARTQSNLGTAYSNLLTGDRGENLKQAIACYENALRMLTQARFPRDYAQIQSNLGAAYSNLPKGNRGENLKQAIACHKNALRVRTEDRLPLDYAQTQNNLGLAYSNLSTGERRKNLRQAIACYENVLRVRSEKEFPQDRVDTLFNLALTYDKAPLNDWHKAYDTCDEAINVLEIHVRAVSSAETRRTVAENQAKIYHRMVSLCIRLGKTEEALSYAERGKSRTLVEMLHAAQLMPSEKVPEDVRNAFVAVRDKLEELRRVQEAGEKTAVRDFEITGAETPDLENSAERRIMFRSLPASPTAPGEEISTLRQETQQAYDVLLRQISEFDPEFAASERVQPISMSEIQEMIPEKTVFVECFTGDDGTYLFVLDRKSDISENHLVLKDLTHAELFNNLATENWLRPYYEYLQNQTSETREAWHKAIETTPALLAEKFWYAEDETGKSLSSLVEKSGAERILFLPHSGLHLLPLHLIPLTTEQTPRLMDKYEIAYAPSVSMLRFTLNREALPLNHLFGAANPTKDLAFADTEVRGIRKQFDSARILWHDKAIKSAVLEHAGRGNVVHFSCHGSFQYDNPLDSMLILAGGDKDRKKNLTLKEIFANLKLQEAALVTLSACETGMVKLESGDEYIGLPSGFLYAGASAVISSLWAVSDISTSFLMRRLYENIIAKKMGKAAALREAQQWVRDVTVRDIRPDIEQAAESLEQMQKQAESEEKTETSYYRKLRADIRSLKAALRRDDNEQLFRHPWYWGAFMCTGNWN